MTEIYHDRPLRFTIPSRNARGRTVRLDSVLNDIIAPHDYPVAVKHLVAEAATLAALIGSMLKQSEGQLTMQAQTQGGIIELLVADYKDGEVRSYARYDRDRLAEQGKNPSLGALFGKGYLAITFDRTPMHGDDGQRYQGIVELAGNSLTEACQNYFFQSEQVPTLIKVAISSDENGCRTGGFLVQHLAEGEVGRERLHAKLDHPEWEHVSILAETLNHAELLDRALSMEDLIWRLFHEEDEVLIEQAVPLSKGCRCSVEHYRKVLSRFGEAEKAEMRDENGDILVDCAFCARQFAITD
ncbi:Hsp33 family molecular chaperone HslO [Sphingorhabdus sp. Alg239-R122]|uniref:Hsp33 family molecular chaperone HslO n=1 Tax=Sphingorhabdus sp. Alg239-R122 TaxID=2305989 RepID=UPI0013DD5044|nr:Hsp33 family molecular chaperone HslO [Sphingorhabdus sp. Alg239-R122]